MARKPRPPTERMNQIATVLRHGPMTWEEIQAGMEQNFQWVHGAVLQGILARMADRRLIAEDRGYYRLMKP